MSNPKNIDELVEKFEDKFVTQGFISDYIGNDLVRADTIETWLRENVEGLLEEVARRIEDIPEGEYDEYFRGRQDAEGIVRSYIKP